MMTLFLALCALAATWAAAYCAFVDGALLSIDDDAEPVDPDVRALVTRRERAHRALAFGRIVSQLLAGGGAAAALKASSVPAVQVAPLVVMLGILIVVFAESAARAAGDMAGADVLVRHLRGIRAVENVLKPIVMLGTLSDGALDAFLPAPRDDSEEREISVEQFRDVVAAEAGVSKDDERLLRGVFSLGDTTAQDIMVPRVDVIGADRAWSWSALVDRVRRAGHARYVVFDGTIDNVVGVLNAKDLLPSVLAGSEPADGWRAMVRPAQFIPATKPVDDQLRDFKASRQHLAVVVDEFGGTAGIVTLEDALEVIVGDIRDEHDVEEAEVRRDATGGLSVSARLPLDDLAELIGEDLSGEDVHTIGGLVYARVGGAPRVGDAVTVGGHRLVIERVHRRRIVRVAVQRVPEPAQGQP
jgi:CBS domain containing-hemolysin-like protein